MTQELWEIINIGALRGGVTPKPHAPKMKQQSAMPWQIHNRAYLLCLPMTQRGIVFCPPKTEGRTTRLPVNGARGKCFFCLGMASLPADDAREAYLYIASNGCVGARSHLRYSLGRMPSRFVPSSSVFLGARKHAGGRSSKAHLTRSLAVLASLEHPAGRNLATVLFASFDLF